MQRHGGSLLCQPSQIQEPGFATRGIPAISNAVLLGYRKARCACEQRADKNAASLEGGTTSEAVGALSRAALEVAAWQMPGQLQGLN